MRSSFKTRNLTPFNSPLHLMERGGRMAGVRMLLAVSFALCILSSALAQEFPKPAGFVNDFAKVIDSATRGKLEELAKDLESKTSAEMAIVTIQTSAPLDPKMYAVKLFEKWGIGKKGKDNGVLMLAAMKERRVEIEVGYGLEGTLTDQFCGQVLDEFVIPYFKEGKFGEGLFAGARALAAKISKEELPSPVKTTQKVPIPWEWIVFFIIILIVLSSIFGRFFGMILGGVIGGLIGYFLAGVIGAIIGFIFGIMVSLGSGRTGGGPIFTGGFGGGESGGGFGGGRSGGGGAGRSW